MILNLERTNKHIVNWLKDYSNNYGRKCFVVELSGDIDPALTALLCKRTRIPTWCVIMSSCSSDERKQMAIDFAQEYNLKYDVIEMEETFTSLHGKIHMDTNHRTHNCTRPYLEAGLRASTLYFLSKTFSGLVVGSTNRSKHNLIRYYNKIGEGCVDLLPLADLFKNEISELFKHVTEEEGAMPDSAKAIYEAMDQTFETDLGMTYDEIEWADRQNIANNIVYNETDPRKEKPWLGYSGRQRQIIAKIHQLEKLSRHKTNSNIPICELRNKQDLVR